MSVSFVHLFRIITFILILKHVFVCLFVCLFVLCTDFCSLIILFSYGRHLVGTLASSLSQLYNAIRQKKTFSHSETVSGNWRQSLIFYGKLAAGMTQSV